MRTAARLALLPILLAAAPEALAAPDAASLAASFQRKRAEALKLDLDARVNRFEERLLSIESLPFGEPRVERALELIALNPADDRGPYHALRWARTSEGEPRAVPLHALVAALDRIYRSGAGDDTVAWKSGRRAFLFQTGDFAGARQLTAELSGRSAGRDRWLVTRSLEQGRVYSMLLARVAGSKEPLAAYYRKCDLIRTGRNGCRQVAVFPVEMAAWTLGRRSPPCFGEILVDQSRAELGNYSRQADLLAAAAEATPERAEAPLVALVTTPPPLVTVNARLEGIDALRRIAEGRSDWAAAIVWTDRYLVTAGIFPPPFFLTAWDDLRSVAADTLAPEPDEEAEDRDALLARKLEERFRNAVRHGSGFEARRTFEVALVHRLRTGGAARLRTRLVELARAEEQLGEREAALRIAAYLAPQPLEPADAAEVVCLRERLGVAPYTGERPPPRPWDTAAEYLTPSGWLGTMRLGGKVANDLPFPWYRPPGSGGTGLVAPIPQPTLPPRPASKPTRGGSRRG